MSESKLIKTVKVARNRDEFIKLVNEYYIPFHLVRYGKLDVTGNSILELKLRGTQFTTIDKDVKILIVCILKKS